MKQFILVIFLGMILAACGGEDCGFCEGTETIVVDGIVVTDTRLSSREYCGEDYQTITKNPITENSVTYLGIQAVQRTVWSCR